MQQMIFIADFIACSTCFGQYYAHNHTDNLKTKAPNTTGNDHLYNTLELLMMGIVLPETCWACNKICNKYNLLHLVGILFPHNLWTSFIFAIIPCWSIKHIQGSTYKNKEQWGKCHVWMPSLRLDLRRKETGVAFLFYRPHIALINNSLSASIQEITHLSTTAVWIK